MSVQADGLALDAKEGVSSRCYERVRRTAILPDGSAIKVVVYEVTPESQDDFVPPTDEYLEIVRRGLGAHGFDSGPVEAAAKGYDAVPLQDVSPTAH